MVPESTIERKKDAEKNDFFMFGFTIIFFKRKLNIIKISYKFMHFKLSKMSVKKPIII